jgi:hypothetical protein
VDGVPFPDWGPRGWPAIGMRTDVVAGRRIVTVFYARGKRVVGYQIVSGRTLAPPVAVHRTESHGSVYRSFTARGQTIVTWVEDGRTCVLSGRGLPPSMLRRLAAW